MYRLLTYNRPSLKLVFNGAGKTVLHAAYESGSRDVFNMLLDDHRIDIDTRDTLGNTVLHLVLQRKDRDFAEFLVGEHDVDVNAYNKSNVTPLHLAAGSGDLDLVELLVENGAEVYPGVLALSGSPLMYALGSDNRNVQTVKYLISKAREEIRNEMMNKGSFKMSPLCASIALKCPTEFVESLIENGADKDGEEGFPLLLPLYELCTSYRDDVLAKRLVTEYGADPNKRNLLGFQPILGAAWKGNVAMVEFLFPLTNPIEGIEDWSVDGIIQYGLSKMDEKARNSAVKCIEKLQDWLDDIAQTGDILDAGIPLYRICEVRSLYEDGIEPYRVDVVAGFVEWLVNYAEEYDMAFLEGLRMANYVNTKSQTWDAGRFRHYIETSKFVKLIKFTAKAAQSVKKHDAAQGLYAIARLLLPEDVDLSIDARMHLKEINGPLYRGLAGLEGRRAIVVTHSGRGSGSRGGRGSGSRGGRGRGRGRFSRT